MARFPMTKEECLRLEEDYKAMALRYRICEAAGIPTDCILGMSWGARTSVCENNAAYFKFMSERPGK